MGHFYTPPPAFVGGRQPYAPRLGVAQSGPTPQAPPLRGPMVAATFSLIVSAWQPPSTVTQPQVKIAALIPAVVAPSQPPARTSAFQAHTLAWYIEPTTVIGLASFAPQQAPDQPPVKTATNLSLIVRGWYKDFQEPQGFSDIAPLAPAPAAPSQPPVITRAALMLTVRAWDTPHFISQGYGEIAQYSIAVSTAQPLALRTNLGLIVDIWRPVYVKAQGSARGLADAAVAVSPTQFYFDTQFNVARSTLCISSVAVLVGMSGSITSVVVNGEQSVNGAAFTTSAVAVGNGDELRLRQTSSASYATQTTTTLTIGTTTGEFVTVTAAAPAPHSPWRRRAFTSPKRRIV